MLVISIALAAITHALLRYLQQAMRAQGDTLKLLDHRIRNNLQAVESLIALDSSLQGRSEALERRVRAISTANDLLLSAPGDPSVGLDALVHALADPKRITIDGRTTHTIPAEQLTEVSIALSDLFTLLDDVGPQQLTLGQTITITLRRPLSEIVDWEKRIGESYTPRHWIRPHGSRAPNVLTVDLT